MPVPRLVVTGASPGEQVRFCWAGADAGALVAGASPGERAHFCWAGADAGALWSSHTVQKSAGVANYTEGMTSNALGFLRAAAFAARTASGQCEDHVDHMIDLTYVCLCL